MAIISRGADAALLMVGLALLSGNARAAEVSYDDYVAQVKAGKLDIDYTAFRLAYAASPKYAPYGAVRTLMGQMKKAYTAGDCPAAMRHAKEVFEVNFVQIDAHMVTAVCQEKAGNEDEAQRAHAMFIGLVKSVLESGDGKSLETAFVVIAIDEEYSVMGALSLLPVRQALVHHRGSAFDRYEAKKRDSGQQVTLYFNVDRPQAQLARTLQDKTLQDKTLQDKQETPQRKP
jgi:Domain of unknown function (DUF4919)